MFRHAVTAPESAAIGECQPQLAFDPTMLVTQRQVAGPRGGQTGARAIR